MRLREFRGPTNRLSPRLHELQLVVRNVMMELCISTDARTPSCASPSLRCRRRHHCRRRCRRPPRAYPPIVSSCVNKEEGLEGRHSSGSLLLWYSAPIFLRRIFLSKDLDEIARTNETERPSSATRTWYSPFCIVPLTQNTMWA